MYTAVYELDEVRGRGITGKAEGVEMRTGTNNFDESTGPERVLRA